MMRWWFQTACGDAETRGEHTIFGQPIQHTIGSNQAGVHRAGQDQESYDDDKTP